MIRRSRLEFVTISLKRVPQYQFPCTKKGTKEKKQQQQQNHEQRRKKLLTRYHKISSRKHEKIIEHDDDSSYSLSPLSLSLSPSQSSRDPSITTRCNKRQARVYVTRNKRQREICKKKEKKERRKKRKRTELKYRGESCSIDARRNKIISRGGGITRIQARIYVSIQKRLAYFAWPRPKEEICLHSKRGFIFISFSLSLSLSPTSRTGLFSVLPVARFGSRAR